MTDAQPLEERIVEVLREAPDDDASIATIRGLMARDAGIRPAVEDVRDSLHELMEEDRVEVVTTAESDDPRYRLVEAGY